MPPRPSAGIILFRRVPGDRAGLEVLLAHPGGPFWARKDDGAWSIPKGEYEPDEEPFAAAVREFGEEVGPLAVSEPAIQLGSVRLSSGKTVTAWAIEGDFDPARAQSNPFELEWPKGSGRVQSFPEVDRVAWFALAAARPKLNQGQVPLLDRLEASIGAG
jgi:predicted NUDIX family NTP pyrophosphohydrolase